MDVYITVAILLLGISIFESYNRERVFVLYKRFFCIRRLTGFIAFAIIFFFGVCRDMTVGTDLINYRNAFYGTEMLLNADAKFLLVHSDIGYTVLNWLVSVFSDDFYDMMDFLVALNVLLLYVVVARYSDEPAFSAYVCVCLGGFGTLFCLVRQSLAIAIIFFAIQFIQRYELKKFIMCLFAAISIHKTSFIAILLYWLGWEKRNARYYIKLLVIGGVIVMLSMIGIQFLVSMYARNDYLDMIVSGTGYKLLMVYVLITIFLGLNIRKIEHLKPYNRLFFNGVVLMTLLQIVSLNFSLFVRMTLYFQILLILIVPNTIASMTSYINRKISRIAVIVFLFMFYLYSLSIDPSGILPYETRF